MKLYEFGNPELPKILLLPGTCCHWKANFGAVIPLLEASFHVICVSYDGFDETENTIFPTMLAECEKIEAAVQQRFDGHLHAAYGCSLGGSFVGLLVQRKQIHIDHAILGSSDLDQDRPFPAMLKAKLIATVLGKMIRTGKLPGWMQKRMARRSSEEQEYTRKFLAFLGVGTMDMRFIRNKSIYNQFYSDLVTPLEDQISVPGTTAHIFYALKMGPQYEERYLQHFKNPDILRQDYRHEELFALHPQKWAKEVKRVCSVSAKNGDEFQ